MISGNARGEVRQPKDGTVAGGCSGIKPSLIAVYGCKEHKDNELFECAQLKTSSLKAGRPGRCGGEKDDSGGAEKDEKGRKRERERVPWFAAKEHTDRKDKEVPKRLKAKGAEKN